MPAGGYSWPDSLQVVGVAPDVTPTHLCQFNPEWLAFVVGAVERLKFPDMWQGTPAEIQECLQQIDELIYLLQKEVTVTVQPAGIVSFTGSADIPTGWLLCDGSYVDEAEYPELFEAIGWNFQSNPPTGTFRLPDLRSRMPLGAGQGAYLSEWFLGTMAGGETITLTEQNLPAHSHAIGLGTATSQAGTGVFTQSYANSVSVRAFTQPSSSVGGNSPFSRMPPVLVLNPIISTGK